MDAPHVTVFISIGICNEIEAGGIIDPSLMSVVMFVNTVDAHVSSAGLHAGRIKRHS